MRLVYITDATFHYKIAAKVPFSISRIHLVYITDATFNFKMAAKVFFYITDVPCLYHGCHFSL